MKQIFNVALTGVKDSSWTDVEGIGELRFGSDGKVYRFVKNAGATTMSAGYPCCHKLSDGENYDQYVYQPTDAERSNLAGICMAAIPPSGFGYIQVYGYNQSVYVTNNTSVTVVAGDNVAPPTAAGWYLDRVSAKSESPTFARHARCFEGVPATTAAAAVAKKCFVDCL